MARKSVLLPIMSADAERYMAFMGLIQWTQAVISQSERVQQAQKRQSYNLQDAVSRQECTLAFHSECHFFCVAAHKLIEHRKWITKFGLCGAVNFAQIDKFSTEDIRDLRNMNAYPHVPGRY